MARPEDSSTSDAAGAASRTCTWDTMNSAGSCAAYNFRVACSLGWLEYKDTFASKEPPMDFALRASSSFTSTADRTLANSSQASFFSGSILATRLPASGNSAICTLGWSSLAFGRYLQISSVVKTRTGAIRRTKALVVFQTAVCAERRDLFWAAFV